jgi:hypothetical protein
MTTKQKLLILSIAISLSISALGTTSIPTSLPVTGSTAPNNPFASQAALPLAKAKKASSVAVENKFIFSVSQSGNNAPSDYSLGQYAFAAGKNSLGFIAHNYLAGSSFSSLTAGDVVTVKYSDGTSASFLVYNVARYKATNSNDFSKPFIASNGKEMSARQVFGQAYKSGQVTFQTCIASGGSNTWGILIVQAKPIR